MGNSVNGTFDSNSNYNSSFLDYSKPDYGEINRNQHCSGLFDMGPGMMVQNFSPIRAQNCVDEKLYCSNQVWTKPGHRRSPSGLDTFCDKLLGSVENFGEESLEVSPPKTHKKMPRV